MTSDDLLLRTSLDPADVLAAARAALMRVDPQLAIVDTKALTERVAAATAARRFTVSLVALFA